MWFNVFISGRSNLTVSSALSKDFVFSLGLPLSKYFSYRRDYIVNFEADRRKAEI